MIFGIVHHDMLPDGSPGFSSNAPRWGATEMMNTNDEIEIVNSEDDTLSPNVLELYAGDGTRVMFTGTDKAVPTNTEACAHKERHYALAPLAVGDYTLVHRKKNGTGDPLNCLDPGCPWTRFDGDEAVTLTLAIR